MADAIPALRRAASAEWRILTLALTLLAGVLGWQNGLGRPDYTLYDAAVVLSGRQPSPEIVIVAIDEASLAAVGRWPWPRAVHATLLERLAAVTPKAIALDLILHEPETSNSTSSGTANGTSTASGADAALARAMRRAAPVVLPVLMESASSQGASNQGATRATLPLPELADSAAAIGHIHVEIDADGIARSVFLREGPALAATPQNAAPTRNPGPPWSHFALALKQVGEPDARHTAVLPGERAPPTANAAAPGAAPDPGAAPEKWQRDHWLHIPYTGAPGSYARVSYVDVLLGRTPASALRGKYVLVGATAAGLGDAYPTPVSGQSRAMPGVEINANVLDALLTGRGIVRAAPWVNGLLSAGIVLAVLCGLLSMTPRRGLVLVTCSLVGVTGGAWGALALAGVWFAPAGCLLALALAYPLWSWRRLEATINYLGQEFARLEAEPDLLPRAPLRAEPPASDLLEQRIRAVEAAAERLRDTRRFATDTLGSLPDATLVADTDGKILLANRTAANHFQQTSVYDLRGRHLRELFDALPARSGRGTPIDMPLGKQSGARFSWDQLRERASRAAEGTAAGAAAGDAMETMEIEAPNGRRLMAHCARSADSRNETIGWIISLIDITALREAETKRDEVLAFLSHDMRSPQSSIIALLELHALDPDQNSKEDIHARIESYARKTLALSDQFLQLSSAETKEYEFAPSDLCEIAEEAIDEVWADAGKKKIAVDWLHDSNPAAVYADRSMLMRAVVNLLTNAIKYSPEHTKVAVSVGHHDERLVLAVADQGYGISVEDQQHLFERYRRFSTPGAPKAAGAGLGMVFVKTVVEKHGGRIAVNSEAGRGTTIALSFPISKA